VREGLMALYQRRRFAAVLNSPSVTRTNLAWLNSEALPRPFVFNQAGLCFKGIYHEEEAF